MGLTITIVPAPGAPVITSPPTISGVINQPLTYQITATNNPTSYNALPMPPATALPPGLSVGGQTGVIGGSPTVSGTFPVILVASNSAGMGTSILTISLASPFPVVTSAQVANGQVGSPFQFQLQASGTPPMTFSTSPLPGGLVLVGFTIVGTPTTAGSYPVQVTATNTFGADTKPLIIVIAPPSAPVITSGLAIQGMANVALPPYQVTASGSTPITYAVVGDLPPGLTFVNGTLGGTPTVPGSYVVTLTAANSAGSDTKTLAVTVNPVIYGADSDGDGFPDELEVFLATNPLDPNSTPFGGQPGISQPFNMQLLSSLSRPKVNIKLNFAKRAGNDAITMSGSLPLPAGFGAAGETVALDIGGVLAKAVLDSRGNYVSPDRTISVKLAAKSGRIGQNAKYSVTLKGSFQAALAGSGLTNQTVTAARANVNIIILVINAQLMFQETDTLLYTAKRNKTGTAK
jgi:PKD repeat protein